MGDRPEDQDPEQRKNVVWSVPRERWQEAQEWELALWRRENNSHLSWRYYVRLLLGRLRLLPVREFGDDWNEWWACRFDNYTMIPATLDSAIELGCGPFTNMRIISRDRAIGHIVCSDPLVRDYARFGGTWLESQYKSGAIDIDDHRAEDLPFPDAMFELTVMINVLDHVQNARQCLESAARITKPGGLLVLGQDLTGPGDPGTGHLTSVIQSCSITFLSVGY